MSFLSVLIEEKGWKAEAELILDILREVLETDWDFNLAARR